MTRRGLPALLVMVGVLATAGGAQAASPDPGALQQLSGSKGCVGGGKNDNCAPARALKGPGPFMGSRALALSPDGRHLYVAAAKSDAVVIFTRNQKRGTLTQPKASMGCVSDKHDSCAPVVGLDGPNSIAISQNGRNVYVTSRNSDTLTAFRRNPSTGALTQIGCIAGGTLDGCQLGIGLKAPDVVVTSNDGKNVYVGSFLGNAVVAFAREATSGAVSQLPGTDGCIAEATAGCAAGIALKAPEGMAISPDGATVYVASAASNAIVALRRDPSSGTLTQATDGTGCLVVPPLTGCTTARSIVGANALTLSGKYLYATSLMSNTVTAFRRSSTGALTQNPGISGCTANLGAANCRFGRAMSAPEGLVVSGDGENLYAAAFKDGAIDVFSRDPRSGQVIQKGGKAACVGGVKGAKCTKGRALRGVSSLVVSRDGKYVYTTSFLSNAVNVFRRG